MTYSDDFPLYLLAAIIFTAVFWLVITLIGALLQRREFEHHPNFDLISFSQHYWSAFRLRCTKRLYDDAQLWPVQRAVKSQILSAFEAGKSFMMVVGQRGGKTELVRNLIRYAFTSNMHRVYVMSPSGDLMRGTSDGLPKSSVQYLSPEKLETHSPEWFKYQLDMGTVFVIEEFTWTPEAQSSYNLLRKHGISNILLVGSNGPNRFRDDPSRCEYFTANTWDMNPTVRRADFQEQYHTDPTRAQRDFEAVA